MAISTKHEQLAGALRTRIAEGIYLDELPSDADLMSEFGYSRATVRQAFTTLENEGLITARSGMRRRVSRPQRWNWPMTTWEKAHNSSEDAWAASVRAQGAEPSTSVSVRLDVATTAIADALRLESGDHVLVRARVRSINGEPHQLADSYFPHWLMQEFPVFSQPGDISAPGGLLVSVGMPQARYLDEIGARMPTPDETQILSIGRGVPLIVHTRTGYHEDGRPLRHMITRMAADQVRVQYELDA